MKHSLFIITFIIFNLFNIINAKNDYYVVSIQRNKDDDNYDSNKKIQPVIDNLVNDRLNDIYNIIKENKDSYIENGKMDEKLKELDSPEINKRFVDNTVKRKFFFINRNRRQNNIFKRSNNSTEEFIPVASKLVGPLCPIFNYYIVGAYLSDTTLEKVQKLSNVIRCEKNGKTYPASYYDLKEIQRETNWSNVSVQNKYSTPEINYYSHLSLISQDKFTQDDDIYDNNYYYPSSAGKGIDIYFLDFGLNPNHDEFDTYGGTREVLCDGRFTLFDSYLARDNQDFDCMDSYYAFHGNMVSSVAGGKIYGAAKKANLHMLYAEGYLMDEVNALDYVLRYGKPYKSVISISRQGNGYYQYLDDKIQELINSGFIVITAAGNYDENCCVPETNDNFYIYAGFKNIITVGATGDTMAESLNFAYDVAYYSNYGKCVDIHAPGYVTYGSIDNSSSYDTVYGTSCSTPLVAGVAALIMSEHPDIKFTNKSMKEYLINLSLKDVIRDLKDDTPNRFLNNGKRKIYYSNSSNEPITTTTTTTTTKTTKTSTTKTPTSTNTGKCGSENDNLSCAPGYCCSKYGYCGKTEKHCLASQGCQSEFGECTNDTTTTITTTTTTKTTTTKTTKTSTTKTPTSTNTGKCGSENDNLSCAPGYCCSKYGYCGNTEKHCLASQGCQSEFGECTNDTTTTTTTTTTKTTKTSKTSTTKTPTSTNTGKCGSANGNLSCAPGYCCSKYGYCGNTEKHCLASQGCQSKFGECTNDTTTTTTTTTKTKTTTTTKTTKTTTTKTTKTSTTKTPTNTNTGKCGSANGNLSCAPGYCCSKYGYCGKTDKHCLASQGCQSKFGECTNDKTTTTTTTKTKTTTTKTTKTSTTKTTKTSTTKTTKTSTTKTTKTSTTKTPTNTNTGKCGKEYGSCASGYCCSKYGYCGKSSAYCDTGCQKEFGECN
ncbi:subtilisin-like protein [Anaeromyces robustus]|uniref:Subtilisin-like protein n=1 Tax=Anaeromyces robustus TaxID=1754192 RepID=A0A1Y1WPY5_9FUNG|nr:subtilisin-like protein [Anaeromyces robustus]|eukprot:ORX75607.1 subtilisin-like protein [Anaeromyces robustus]